MVLWILSQLPLSAPTGISAAREQAHLPWVRSGQLANRTCDTWCSSRGVRHRDYCYVLDVAVSVVYVATLVHFGAWVVWFEGGTACVTLANIEVVSLSITEEKGCGACSVGYQFV